MILTKVNYIENLNKPNYWEIKDVILSRFNLIVGLNATGKTRLLNIIANLAKTLTRKLKRNGCWVLEFKKEKLIYNYELNIVNTKIINETLYGNKKLLLQREKDNGTIFSDLKKKMITFSPPPDELTLNVRRDIKEYPFLEDIYSWGNNLLNYNFSGVMPNNVCIPGSQELLLDNLNTTPYLLQGMVEDKRILDRIINDFSEIGYPVEHLNVRTEKPVGVNELVLTIIKEKDLSCETLQTQMSQGMFRALSLLVIIEHILNLHKECTVVIDDIGEGLDYERASKLTGLLVNKIKGSKIQLIITSNDRFLINSVDIKNINFLERQGHIVKAFNYFNSKDKYEEFIFTGLNNFDFLRGKIYN